MGIPEIERFCSFEVCGFAAVIERYSDIYRESDGDCWYLVGAIWVVDVLWWRASRAQGLEAERLDGKTR
jgi:hypothetical protein